MDYILKIKTVTDINLLSNEDFIPSETIGYIIGIYSNGKIRVRFDIPQIDVDCYLEDVKEIGKNPQLYRNI